MFKKMIKKGIDKVLSQMKGVFFDMDGVLYDSMGAHADAWSRAFHHFGIYFSPAWNSKKKHYFTISCGNVTMKLGGKEARMLHSFLNKVY